MNKKVLGTAAAIGMAGAAVLTIASAGADTTNCVSHAELDGMVAGLNPDQVANRFDIYGVFLDDTASTYRRGYRTCWDPTNRQAVVVFSYASGDSVDWYTRGI